MQIELIEELRLRLRTPWVALVRISKGQNLPKDFAAAALAELSRIRVLINKMEEKIGGGKK